MTPIARPSRNQTIMKILDFDRPLLRLTDMAIQALRIPEIMAEMSRAELVKHADRLHKLEAIARRSLNLEEAPIQPVVNIGLLTGDELPPLEIPANASEIPDSPAD